MNINLTPTLSGAIPFKYRHHLINTYGSYTDYIYCFLLDGKIPVYIGHTSAKGANGVMNEGDKAGRLYRFCKGLEGSNHTASLHGKILREYFINEGTTNFNEMIKRISVEIYEYPGFTKDEMRAIEQAHINCRVREYGARPMCNKADALPDTSEPVLVSNMMFDTLFDYSLCDKTQSDPTEVIVPQRIKNKAYSAKQTFKDLF